MIVNVNIMALLFSCCIMFMINNPNRMSRHFKQVISFLDHVQKNNPTILEFEEVKLEDLTQKEQENNKSVVHFVKPEPIKYENKYLKKYTELANEYIFNEDETLLIDCEYERLKYNRNVDDNNNVAILTDRFEKINAIFLTCDSDMKITDVGVTMLLELVGLTEEYEYDPLDVDITGLLLDLTVEMKQIEVTLKNAIVDNTDELKQEALDFVINKKLDNLINNYVMEYTPLGNIYMRYNNYKQSFEYFSNNSIPYRYLEPVGRKYVTTFFCKPIFIDLEEELKKADEKWESEYKKHEDYKKQELDNPSKSKQKNQLVKLKNYNNDSFKQPMSNQPSKNRNQTNFVLPPQIKANLPDVNQKTNKQLLKDRANRYTWEGRLSSFNVLKKIDKKLTDKHLTMTFTDFKRMRQSQ
jgi:hypothetical protein